MSLSLNFHKGDDDDQNKKNNPVRRRDLRKSTGLPKPQAAAPGAALEAFNDPSKMSAMFDDDDESQTIQQARETGVIKSYHKVDPESEEALLKALQESLKEHREKHTNSKIRASRFVTADLLLNAPRGYYRKFEQQVSQGVNWIREQLAERGTSGSISEAQRAPMDESLQEEAYGIVNAVTLEFMDSQILHGVEREIVKTFIINEIIGFGPIDPLWRDRSIDEIAINGPRDIQIQVRGKRLRVPGCEFMNEDHVMGLLERIFSAGGKQLSRTVPNVKGRLHDNSRIHATHTSVAPAGPNVLIRRHPAKYWTPQDLIDKDSASEEMLAYLGNLIYKGCSVAVIGGTGSGKTTFLNALTGFYRDDARILTLEDNIEMLPNPTKMLAAPMETRPASSSGEGGVTMRDLVRASLQMSPDVLILGEVSDHAAMDLIQALNTGHYGASTVHANTAAAGMYRLSSLVSQSGEATLETALPLIATAFDIVVQLQKFPSDGSRRIVSISEVALQPELDPVSQKQHLPVRDLWKYRTEGIDQNSGKVHGYWEQVSEISQARAEAKSLGLERDLSWAELSELSSIPEHLQKVEQSWNS